MHYLEEDVFILKLAIKSRRLRRLYAQACCQKPMISMSIVHVVYTELKYCLI